MRYAALRHYFVDYHTRLMICHSVRSLFPRFRRRFAEDFMFFNASFTCISSAHISYWLSSSLPFDARAASANTVYIASCDDIGKLLGYISYHSEPRRFNAFSSEAFRF